MAYCYEKGLKFMENCITCIKSIVENGWWRMRAPHPTPPPVSAPGHKLQKPSKESGIFHSLGTINFVLFTKRQNQRGGGHGPIAHRHISDVTNTQLGRINDTVHQRQNWQVLLAPPEVFSNTPKGCEHPQSGTAGLHTV